MSPTRPGSSLALRAPALPCGIEEVVEVSEAELGTASTQWKDLRGTVSLDYDATFRGARWHTVDGYVTWAVRVGFLGGSAHVTLFLHPVEADHDVDRIIAAAQIAGELQLFTKTLDPIPLEDFWAVFSTSDLVLRHKTVPPKVRIVSVSFIDDLDDPIDL